MKITLELFASLMSFLPSESSLHAADMEIDHDFTLNNLIDRMEIPRKSAHIVLLNGKYVNADDRDQPCLHAGDKVSIWPQC